jgi:adenylate cyclase
MGRSFARLAEWEIAEIAAGLSLHELELDEASIEGLIAQILPVAERLQNYAWRRHLVNAAGRLLLQPEASASGVPMAVGFADIVGFTRQSRRMTGDELSELVEMFESTVSTIIAGQGGRVIKTIGDEVLYAADDVSTAARIALELAEGHELNEEFPDVRVGVAYGDVLSRMGDVFGEVVNIASRLTSLAKPGRVLVNREMAELLREDDDFRVRRSRTTTVKGYARLETWSLKRPKPPPEGADAEKEAEREARRDARREAARDVLRSADPAIEALESLAEKLTQPRKSRRDSDNGPPDENMP